MLQAYPDYQESGVAWVGKIPSTWSVGRIRDHVDLLNGYPFASEGFSSTEGVPLVRIRDIAKAKAEVMFSGEVVEEALIETGDTLIGMDGDFNVCRWRGGRALLNQRVCCVRAKVSVLDQFVAYLLPFPLKTINDLTYFTTVKHLSSNDILRIKFALPPIAEQRAIAFFLDRETAKIDGLIEKKRRLIALLREKRQALISHAVTKGLNPDAPMKDSGVEWLSEVPAHWRIVRLKHVLRRIEQGWSPECENRVASDDEWGVLKAGCVNGGVFNVLEHKTLPADLLPPLGLKVVAGDVLMSRASGSTELIGSVAYVEDCQKRLLLSDKTFRLIYQERQVDPAFLALSLGASSARAQIKGMIRGAEGLANNISQAAVKDIAIALPPCDEQRNLVSEIKEENQKIDTGVATIGQAIERLQEHRSALISAAVTGKIDVRGLVAEAAA